MSKSESWQEKWTMNSFPSLLTDAIAFDLQAQTKDFSDFPTMNRYSKASILNSIFAIEAAANSCIARMKYPKLIIEQLDKLSIVDKYDILYTAQSKSGKNINRGNTHFQIIKELFYFRNRYVHPKLIEKETKVKINKNKNNTKIYEQNPKLTQVLKIPYDFNTWTGEHSHIVVKKTINFFNYFFIDLCGFTKEKSSELLSVFAQGPVNTATFLAVHEVQILKKVKNDYGVDINFLNFNNKDTA